jgi:hypothetical protein
VKAIPHISFKQYFQNWKRQWERCITAQGGYFVGDNIQYTISRERYYLQTISGTS